MDPSSSEYRPLFGNHLADRPLFGQANRTGRILNLVVGSFTSLYVVLTVILGFFVASWPPKGLHIYLCICILLICFSHLLLIHWYRQGDIDPKFRLMIYFNAFTLFLLCTYAIAEFFSPAAKQAR